MHILYERLPTVSKYLFECFLYFRSLFSCEQSGEISSNQYVGSLA
jgi:hypothetical protein